MAAVAAVVVPDNLLRSVSLSTSRVSALSKGEQKTRFDEAMAKAAAGQHGKGKKGGNEK
jgi:hypothetical protein